MRDGRAGARGRTFGSFFWDITEHGCEAKLFLASGKMKGKQEQNDSPPHDLHTPASLAMNKLSLHLVSQQLTQVGNKVANHINDSSPFLQKQLIDFGIKLYIKNLAVLLNFRGCRKGKSVPGREIGEARDANFLAEREK